jgi:ATP-dependent helicase HrpB
MIVDLHRLGAGEKRRHRGHPDRARLGGDSADLDFRLDRSAATATRCSRAASPALAQGGGTEGGPARIPAFDRRMLAFAFPTGSRSRGNGSFLLANGRGAAVDQTSALARAPYIAVAELTGTAAQGRILLAAPIAQAEIELRFADQIESADEISFDRGAMALRARRRKTLHAITLSEAPWRCSLADTALVLADGLIAAGLTSRHGRKR